MALFVPLGAAVGLVARARWLWTLVALSIAVEVLQLGLPDRQTEPIDVASNSAGAVVGFLRVRRAPSTAPPEPLSGSGPAPARMRALEPSLASRLDHWLELQRTQLQPSTWRQYAGTGPALPAPSAR
jgi:hypothetical protein